MLAVAAPRSGDFHYGFGLAHRPLPEALLEVPQRKLSGTTSAAAAAVESSLWLLSKTRCEAGVVGREGVRGRNAFAPEVSAGLGAAGGLQRANALRGNSERR